MNLLDLNHSELCEYMSEKGLPKFRGKQVYDALMQAKPLAEISTLSKEIKELLKDDYPTWKVVKLLESHDGTKKMALSLYDGNIVESVLLKYKYGYTVCVSTQVGCRMGCQFCASTLGGLVRNLSAGEILLQILIFNRLLGATLKDRKITNVVLMGSGEPLDNYDNVTKFLRLAMDENGLNISQRNISLSTCGLVPKIRQLADDNFSITLTISLHAPNDEIRKKIMPIANAYKISEILDACSYYFEKTGRRVVFEYALIEGINSSEENMRELAHVLKGRVCHVNLIPLNSIKEKKLLGVERKRAYTLCGILEKLGISATVRRTMGEDIEGACGQLRNKLSGENV